MSQLSLHGIPESHYPVDESLRSENMHDAESSERSHLAAPKSFFGHRITFDTVTEHSETALDHLAEIEELQSRSVSGRYIFQVIFLSV